MSERIAAWCVDCGGRFTEEQIEGASCCPGCGSAGVPCSPNDDVQVAINWHELRVLTIWAENYAGQTDKRTAENDNSDGRSAKPLLPTVKAIARRLQAQFPTRTPLTLSGELAQLKAEYPGLEVAGDIQPDADALPPKVN